MPRKYFDTFKFNQTLTREIEQLNKKHKSKIVRFIKFELFIFFKFFKKRYYVKNRSELSLPSNTGYSIKDFNFDNLRLENLTNIVHDPNRLVISIQLDGGIGDCIACSVWIKFFKKQIKSINDISVFVMNKTELSQGLFDGVSYVDRVFNRDDLDQDKINSSDIVIKFRRLPYFFKADLQKISKLSPNLVELIEKYRIFYIEHQKYYHSPIFDAELEQYSILLGQNRIQQPDLLGLMGITADDLAEIPIKKYSELEKLKFDLKYILERKYITVGTSFDMAYAKKGASDVRAYPFDKLGRVIKKFKEINKDVLVVQLGGKEIDTLNGVDFNLTGKTNFESLKILLKNSLVHVDNESGFVHLKHHLGGRSIVLFGPTPIDFYQYKTDICIKGNGCCSWCEWVTDSWHFKCARGFAIPKCMSSIDESEILFALKSLISSSETA